MKKPARLIALLFVLMVSYGCAAALLVVGAGVGVGAYKYIDGSLSRAYPVEYSKSWDQANTALENLHISITASLNEGTKGTIEGVKQDGQKVVIKLEDKGQKVTYISIRVGMFGNREEAERIHDEIAKIAGI
ncbi:MAG: DUF3568 family protein [Nitrospirae bacterium]|nr:DUF3568 family protein [Nitrospirota bacterium]